MFKSLFSRYEPRSLGNRVRFIAILIVVITAFYAYLYAERASGGADALQYVPVQAMLAAVGLAVAGISLAWILLRREGDYDRLTWVFACGALCYLGVSLPIVLNPSWFESVFAAVNVQLVATVGIISVAALFTAKLRTG